MTNYISIKTSKFKKKVLKWLENINGVEITNKGKHAKIHCIHNGRSFTLPLSHRQINRFIIKDFITWLEKNEICTREEFDNKL